MIRTWQLIQRLAALLLLPAAALIVLPFALAIRRWSEGSALLIQPREGMDGAVFPMFKLRTMYEDASECLTSLTGARYDEWLKFGRLVDDPRIAGRAARYARRFSIDELPQLINIVRGEMALVGPRPLPPEIAALLNPAELEARRRVRPGLTGLWQVSGRSDLDLTAMGHLDREYVSRQSVLLDLEILLKTVPAALLARGAY